MTMGMSPKKIVWALGGTAEVAKLCKVSSSTVRYWSVRNCIAADKCPIIEEASNGIFTCEEMRPDLLWARVDGKPVRWFRRAPSDYGDIVGSGESLMDGDRSPEGIRKLFELAKVTPMFVGSCGVGLTAAYLYRVMRGEASITIPKYALLRLVLVDEARRMLPPAPIVGTMGIGPANAPRADQV